MPEYLINFFLITVIIFFINILIKNTKRLNNFSGQKHQILTKKNAIPLSGGLVIIISIFIKFYLIDVRDHDEYLSGNIENSTHISRGWLEFKIQNYVSEQDAKIVLYCGSGGRSAFAAQRLNQLGFTDVYSMQGGIKGWAQAGFDII